MIYETSTVDEPPNPATLTLIRHFLGCDWGSRVSLPEDPSLCPRQATQRVAIHGLPSILELKVCEGHFARLVEHTNPHTGGPA